MGTGVGEAMLIGAMTGAGTSAITGNDPLKGALLGAAGGGLGAGLGGALAGGTSGAAGGAAGGTAGGTAGGVSGATAAPITNATLASGAPMVPGLTASAPSVLPTTVTAIPGSTAGSASGSLGGGVSAGSPFAGNVGASMDAYSLANPILPEAATISPTTVAAQPAATPPMKFMDVFKGDTGTVGSRLGTYMQQNPTTTAMTGAGIANAIGQRPPGIPGPERYDGPLSKFKYDPERYRPAFAEGGIADLPAAMQYRKGGDLGMFSDGGRMTKGPGDGMSDDIPAMIGSKQPARLADSEFVIPADVVSHLGNGSTDAGAKQLYAMMDRVRAARTGTKKQGKEINPRKYLPA
jgi:hypothetical protein